MNKNTTIILHTKDRHEMLRKQIEYVSDQLSFEQLIITDASELPILKKNKDIIQEKNVNSTFVHLDGRNKSFPQRLISCLDFVTSPVVILASDDDFIMAEWLKKASDQVVNSSTYLVVSGVGLSLFQSLACSGKLGIKNSTPIPPYRYLGSPSSLERLKELAKGNWQTSGWYAVQPTTCLLEIANLANKFQLDDYTFERFLIFHQCLHARTVFDSDVSHVRRVYISNRAPYTTTQQKNNLVPFLRACEESLSRSSTPQSDYLFLAAYDAIQHELLHLRLNNRNLNTHYLAVKYLFKFSSLFRRGLFKCIYPRHWMFDARLPKQVGRNDRIAIQGMLTKYIK